MTDQPDFETKHQRLQTLNQQQEQLLDTYDEIPDTINIFNEPHPVLQALREPSLSTQAHNQILSAIRRPAIREAVSTVLDKVMEIEDERAPLADEVEDMLRDKEFALVDRELEAKRRLKDIETEQAEILAWGDYPAVVGTSDGLIPFEDALDRAKTETELRATIIEATRDYHGDSDIPDLETADLERYFAMEDEKREIWEDLRDESERAELSGKKAAVNMFKPY